MDKRLTKEFEIGGNRIFKNKLGTLNKQKPSVLYIHGKAKAKPFEPNGDYTDTVANIRDSFCRYIDDMVRKNTLFENKNIVNFDVSDRGLSVGRGSHVKYEIYVKPVVVKDMNEYVSEMGIIADRASEKLCELFDKNDIECY